MIDKLQKVLKVLKASKGGLTKEQIFKKTGYYNVGDAVLKLRREHDIDTMMIEGIDRDGRLIRYARYKYVSGR